MLPISLLLALPAISAFGLDADSLECGLQRQGGAPALALRGEMSEGAAQATADSAGNELGLGLDASLSKQSLFLVLEDGRRQTRAAFSASPNGASEEGFMLASGESQVRCAKHVKNPPKVMPARPELPEYFVCVLDGLKYSKGSLTETKRLGRKAMSTALFNLPVSISTAAGGASFAVKLNRMDWRRGLDVSLKDDATGLDARYVGPASTLQSSFLIGLTIGNRADEAKFLRLGCVYTNDAQMLKQP
jgi:hypothetical protein